jgi:hypothetical protein
VLDGTLIRTDRLRADRPYFSGKRRCHGMNIQVIAGADGSIIWTSGAMPGSVHDLRAARIWGVPRALARCSLLVLADKGYLGADELLVPYRGRNKPASQKQANRSHAKLRAPGERAMARLKSWKLLHKLRCSPSKTGHLVKAIAVLANREAARG